MIYDFDAINLTNIPECLNKVIALLTEANTLITALINIPFADPQDPVWDEFKKRPHINEFMDMFSSVYNAEKLAKETLSTINTTPPA